MNDQPYFVAANAKMVYAEPTSYLHIFTFYIRKIAVNETRFIGTITGDGFDKLGFNLPTSDDGSANRLFKGKRHADLSQPPVILV